MILPLFGGVWSPSLAFALKKTADDNMSIFPANVINAAKQNFNFDDLLHS